MSRQVIIEKETIIKEVRGDRKETVTVRIIIATDGKERTILLTPTQFKAFQKEVAKVTV